MGEKKIEASIKKYSLTERFLHFSAFKSWSFQQSLSKFEDKLYKNDLSQIDTEKPVFITALPRAGTTLLLEIFMETEEFASHTYRNMPYLLSPIFWNRFSANFRKTGIKRERAHGDGMTINEDSPEAFEEIIWKGFWSSRYLNNRIVPWTETAYPEFESFFRKHMMKLIFLKKENNQDTLRYISKNNLNIARIPYLKKTFPDSTIIIPFRSPLQHASSLLRQHLNFTKIHSEDLFAMQYMKDIGHFDFGENLRPVDFNRWFSQNTETDSTSLSFWLQYWISTYDYLINDASNHAVFFNYDDFCVNPLAKIERLSKIIGIKNLNLITNSSKRVLPPKPYLINETDLPNELVDKANEIFEKLNKFSI